MRSEMLDKLNQMKHLPPELYVSVQADRDDEIGDRGRENYEKTIKIHSFF